ncbi:hemerythrin domain-containing protein [Brevibacillus fulvus]|uniref:Hemerythrin-like domain-containing protein n=1 Tax=Brevibacillus fulvus TaxID=1125967 RepID=A0A939BWN9_9BACL|nr:hemerythrin domain-containing protein [Brevibacillus fulvus]MBM7591976.1 hemerythrin-like domain-containing protein [Brevibacillus fulvus]
MSNWKDETIQANPKEKAEELKKVMSVVAPELHTFIEEHAELDQWMDRVRAENNRALYREALQIIQQELEQHFLYEEQFILPKLGRYFATTEVGPVFKLIQEHDIIRKNYRDAEDLMQESDSERFAEVLQQKMNLLAYLLKKHIEKEDHYFFPLVSLVLTPAECQEIADQVAHAHHA